MHGLHCIETLIHGYAVNEARFLMRTSHGRNSDLNPFAIFLVRGPAGSLWMASARDQRPWRWSIEA